MATKKTIAIIGATTGTGAAIATSLASKKYRLLLMAENKVQLLDLVQSLQQLNSSVEAEAADCAHEACWEADIIIPAVPYDLQATIAKAIKDVAVGKIVISLINAPATVPDSTVSKYTTSVAEELQTLLPYSKVVKAFNTIPLQHFLLPAEAKQLVECFVAGDDDEAVQTVLELISYIGFKPVVSGGITKSRVLEEMALLLAQPSTVSENAMAKTVE